MAKLNAFTPPAGLDDLSAAAAGSWTTVVSGQFVDAKRTPDGPQFPQFYDPTHNEHASDAKPAVVEWPAFPSTLNRPGRTDKQRWDDADDRDKQDEYCEWAVTRDDDRRVIRVTFTTETPDYYEHLLDADEPRFVALYTELAGRPVDPDAMKDQEGRFDRKNAFNRAGDGTIVHLSQDSNNLFAAVALAGAATVVREENGRRVTDGRRLVDCGGGFGIPTRNSDPQIAISVNNQAAQGASISLADPPGLFLGDFLSAGIETPDGADAREFWTVTRGTAQRPVRAVFEVPEGRGYTVADIRTGGHEIDNGGQLAEHVQVRLVAAVLPGDAEPVVEPCVGG
jgi:hypothetical protein